MRLSLVTAMLLVASSAAAHPAVGIVVDRSGTVFYSDTVQVWAIRPDGTRVVAVPDVHTHELWLDRDGALHGEHLWYEGDATREWGHRVWRRTSDGTAYVSEHGVVWRVRRGAAPERLPAALSVSRERMAVMGAAQTSDGGVVVAAYDDRAVRRLSPSGVVTTVTTTPAGMGSDRRRRRAGRRDLDPRGVGHQRPAGTPRGH